MLLDLEPTTWEVHDLHQHVCHDRYSFVSFFLTLCRTVILACMCRTPCEMFLGKHMFVDIMSYCIYPIKGWRGDMRLFGQIFMMIYQSNQTTFSAADSFTWTFTPFSSVLQIHSPSPFPRKHAFPCPNPKFAPEKNSNIPGHRPSWMPFSRWKKEGSIQWE